MLKVRGNGYISFNGKEYGIGEAFNDFHVAVRPSEIDGDFFIYFGQHVIKTISFAKTNESDLG